MRLIETLVILLVVQGVSGCLETKTPASDSTFPDSQSAGPPPSQPASTGLPSSGPSSPLPNATLPNLRFEGCRGGTLGIDVPDALTYTYIPPAFEPGGTFPGLTQLNSAFIKCPRVTFEHAVRENVSLFWSYARVNPHNESWSNHSLDFYAFDLLVTDVEVVQALQRAGAKAELVTFREESTPVANQLVVVKWTFNNARVSYALTYNYPTQTQIVKDEYKTNYWYGTEPYYRVAVAYAYWFYGVQSNDVGVLELSGDSPFVKILGVSPVPLFVTPFENLTWDVPATPMMFQTNNG